MKAILQFVFPTVKAIFAVFGFLIGLGWGAYGAVSLIVKAEGKDIRREVLEIRKIDMEHLNKRFDKIEQLIKDDK